MNNVNTIFDDVFRTMVEKMPGLVISLVNEVFHTAYLPDTRVVPLQNEHQLESGERITDSLLLIKGKIYHFECQRTDDQTMAIRMIEYDFLEAFRKAEKTGRKYRMWLPSSCVIYLRDSRNTPDELEVEMILPDGTGVDYRVPTLKVSKYSADDILKKKLFLLLPYYILRYEKKAAELRPGTKAYADLMKEYEHIRAGLDTELMQRGESCLYTDLTALITRISDYIFKDEADVRKGIGDVMGGKILQLESERLLAEGEARGEARGILKGEARGEARGQKKGESRINGLYAWLLDNGRLDDLKKSVKDHSYQEKLLEEYDRIFQAVNQ